MSKFTNEEHLVLLIDGTPLDVILSRALPGFYGIEGLVPTLLDWLYDENERAIVWERALPSPGAKVIFPVLMCPDDTDLWCTVVVAEVEASPTQVIWHRLGIDATDSTGYTSTRCGEMVNWVNDVGSFVFNRADYERCLETFRSELNQKAD